MCPNCVLIVSYTSFCNRPAIVSDSKKPVVVPAVAFGIRSGAGCVADAPTAARRAGFSAATARTLDVPPVRPAPLPGVEVSTCEARRASGRMMRWLSGFSRGLWRIRRYPRCGIQSGTHRSLVDDCEPVVGRQGSGVSLWDTPCPGRVGPVPMKKRSLVQSRCR